MYLPPLRSHYTSVLMNMLGETREFKSSTLLQAYATFYAMKKSGMGSFEAYASVCGKYTEYKHALLRLTDQQRINMCAEDINEFLKLPLREFLMYVTPDIACDPNALMEMYCDYFPNQELDETEFVHHIIAIKLNSYQKVKQLAGNGDGVDKEDALEAIYRYYKASEKNPLPKESFKAFYSAINLYRLNPNELTPRIMAHNGKHISELLSILFNELQLTRAQSLKMVRDFFCDYDQATKIGKNQQVYNFVQLKDEASRIKLLSKAIRLMAKMSPLELICAISMRKKDGVTNERNKTEAYILQNDVTLENGLLYYLFFSEITPESDSDILVLFPSPHFVSKVLWSSEHRERKITFVFNNENISEALTYQSGDVTYAPEIGENLCFESYEKWIRAESEHNRRYSNVLFFGTRFGLAERRELGAVLAERCIDDSSMLALDYSQYIESGNVGIFDSGDIVAGKIGLIPQGINNSTQPRRKVLIRCKINPYNQEIEQSMPIELYTYTLNTVLKTQALSPMHENPVQIDRAVLRHNPQTLRQLYSKEITLRHSAGRERNPSFAHEITPDIVVWCSKTYPKNNRSRPRLEAYVCEPAPASRINSGFTERGPRIKSTIKHTTSIKDEDVLDWLENVYPYSVISAKQTKDNTNSAQVITSVQEEIITHYTEYLCGQNIALKTLWYLYPSLADRYSESAYEIFSAMMRTVIGEQRVSDITVELGEYLLISTYPELSQNSLWARFEMISTALDQAVVLGYCESNNLRQALRQAHVRDKLFAQVRRALAKKHFTRGEMQSAYDFVFSKLEQLQYQYLGVLIRLTTGLESKIVCALRWSDLLFYADYNLYSIIVARQMNYDGSFEGFRDSEDYLTFPLSKRLQSTISEVKRQCGIKNDSQLILNSLLPKNGEGVGITPKVLNQLTREMIEAIGIDERIVSLPYNEEQGRETDLNKYNGDIIRENFRFWATEAGKLNPDELAYLLRNNPPSTLGRYYCDFLNEASQLILHVKLNRIDADIQQRTNLRKYAPCSTTNYKVETAVDDNERKTVLLEVHSGTETSVKIGVNSLYGISYEVALLGEE